MNKTWLRVPFKWLTGSWLPINRYFDDDFPSWGFQMLSCRAELNSSYSTGSRYTPAPTHKGSLQYVCVGLHIPLYPLCCPQTSAMMSLHLSWQVTVLWQHRAQQGSFNLPTICQAPKPALSCHLLHTDHSDTSSLCQETALEITI